MSKIEYKRGVIVEKPVYNPGMLEVTGVVNGQASEITQTEAGRRSVEITRYSDADLNGLFAEAFEIEVNTSAVRLEQHKLTMKSDGTVTADYEYAKRGWTLDRKDWDESYQSIDKDGDGRYEYVVKIDQNRGGEEFEIFRDDDGDGIYAKVAEGETAGEFEFNFATQYLASADTIIG